jgi:hypothetical protein
VGKLFVALERRPAVEPAAFWDALEELFTELGAAATRCVENRVIREARVPGVEFSALDAIYELWFADAAGAAAALADDGWRGRLLAGSGPLATPTATLVLAAREAVQFDRGAGAVKFIAFPKRNPRFATKAEWIDYWAAVHGPLAHGIPEFTRYYTRYVHNYTLPCEHASGGLEPACDGIVEEWVASVVAFASCLAEPCYRDVVAPDERHFLDLDATRLVLATEREI